MEAINHQSGQSRGVGAPHRAPFITLERFEDRLNYKLIVTGYSCANIWKMPKASLIGQVLGVLGVGVHLSLAHWLAQVGI